MTEVVRTTEQLSRPLGIIIIAIYSVVSGVLTVVGGLGLFLVAPMAKDAAMFARCPAPLLSVLGICFFVIGMLEIAISYGLWTFRPWGLSIARLVYLIAIPLGILFIFIDPSPSNVLLQLNGIMMAIMVLFYFNKAETEALYGIS